MTDPFSTTAPPSTIPTTASSSVSIWRVSPTFFSSTSAAVLPRTTARSAASRGRRPETILRFFQEKPPHSPRGDDHHLRVLDAHQVHEQGAGFRDMLEA